MTLYLDAHALRARARLRVPDSGASQPSRQAIGYVFEQFITDDNAGLSVVAA